MKDIIVAAKKGLESNGFVVYTCSNARQAIDTITQLIRSSDVVRDGGSQTLIETGIMKSLQKSKLDYVSHNDDGLSMEDKRLIMDSSMHADTFLMSSNAVTVNGELINVDGTGNRVASLIYGPKQVIVVVGSNKIVEDEVAAIKRIKTIAAAKNCERLNKKTPCVYKGECMNCKSIDRICTSYVKIDFQKSERIKVIIIDGEYGY